jgi:hypothetical protein
MGQKLRKTVRAVDGQPYQGSGKNARGEWEIDPTRRLGRQVETLPDWGIRRDQPHKWQTVASLSDEEFEAGLKNAQSPLTWPPLRRSKNGLPEPPTSPVNRQGFLAVRRTRSHESRRMVRQNLTGFARCALKSRIQCRAELFSVSERRICSRSHALTELGMLFPEMIRVGGLSALDSSASSCDSSCAKTRIRLALSACVIR